MPRDFRDQLDVDPHPDGVTIRRKRRPGDAGDDADPVLRDGEGIRVPAMLMDSNPPPPSDRPVYGRFSPEGFSAWAARGAALQDAWKSPDTIYEEALQELRELRHETDSGVTRQPERPWTGQIHPGYHAGTYDALGAEARREADLAWEARGRAMREAWRSP